MLGEIEKSLKKTSGGMLPSTHRSLERSAREASEKFFESDEVSLYSMLGLEPEGVHDLKMDEGLPPGFQKGTLF